MASSSHSHVYDIFINHRGPDVKNTVASHIYSRLKKSGLEVFLDLQELEAGEKIFPQIEGAIRTASVHVAIFSPNYAESRWCLDELLQMVESGSTIIPVFYKVQPQELRWLRGKYGRDLETHEKRKAYDLNSDEIKRRNDPNTIRKWRDALSAVSDIYGFELHDEYDDYEQQIDKIVRQILKKVRRPPLNVAEYPTGLDEKIEDLEMTLSFREPQNGNGRIVGIVGPAGVGKTTLAKQLFNRWRSYYDRHCFLFDVRSNPLQSLQTILLKDLIQSDVPINRVEEGIQKLRMHLSARVPSLIVLDDVDHTDQLNALLSPVKDVLDQHSLILVTCRNMDVLRSSDIRESSIYQMIGLNRQPSSELFCSYAFGQPIPLAGFEELVSKFLDVCSGSPLSLKVNGESLRGEDDPENWKAKLRRISKTLPAEIHSSLEISYKGLDEEDKQMFLDVACFFIGEDTDTVIRIWAGSGWEGRLGLRNLKNSCLVEVDSENRIRMDPHVRDIGRYEAEKMVCSRRLWRWKDNLLSDVSDRSPVRGINTMVHPDGDSGFENFGELADRLLALPDMSTLQLLKSEGYFVEKILGTGLSPQLIWLWWHNCPHRSLPPSIPINNLRVLQIKGSSLETLWQHDFLAPRLLRELNVDAPLVNIPKSIGELKFLEKVVLQSINLDSLPYEFGHLQCLKHLELKMCKSMKSLPHSIVALTNLQYLYLAGCSNLQMLPNSFENLTNLHHIDLSQCSNLQFLPESFGYLKSLHHIDLSQCSNLQFLPESFGYLTNLHHIELSQCPNLQRLPDSVGCLTNLHHIDLSQCSNLKMLPDSSGCLTNLHHINLSECSNLQFLPDSFAALRNLEHLNLSRWSNLHVLPDYIINFKNLQHIDLGGCSNLRMLPDSFAELSMLRHIDITGCFNLETFPAGIWERD